MATNPANVYGGSAGLTTATPIRMIQVRETRPFAQSLDVQVYSSANPPTGGAVLLQVQIGAGQTAQNRQYRLESGRMILPVFGDYFTVDAYLENIALPLTVTAFLAVGAAANGPVPWTSAQSVSSVLGAGAITLISGSFCAQRAIWNGTAADLAVFVNGSQVWRILANETLVISYMGDIELLSLPGGPYTVANFHL
jgi:hypothetical protein